MKRTPWKKITVRVARAVACVNTAGMVMGSHPHLPRAPGSPSRMKHWSRTENRTGGERIGPLKFTMMKLAYWLSVMGVTTCKSATLT